MELRPYKKYSLENERQNGRRLYSSQEKLDGGRARSTANRKFVILVALIVLLVVAAVAVGVGVHYGSAANGPEPGQQKGDQATKSTPTTLPKTSKENPRKTTTTTIPRPTTSDDWMNVSKTSKENQRETTTTTIPRPTTSDDWMNVSCDIPTPAPCSGSSFPLLLISLDGFRADYLQRHLTPVISRLGQCGVHTPYMRSVFPTMTFPNHYSIVTGLYPESHGIVGNTMYDEKIGKLFTLRSSTKMNPVWWGGEPIWITAKKQGKKTAAYFWVGSDVNITGVYPDRWFMYNGSHTNEDRINKVLDWLSLPDTDRPDIITTYFNEPDHEGHESGPFDEKMNEMLVEVDDVIKSLMDGLSTRGLHQCVNIMVVADHGLTSTHCYRELDYSDFTNTSLYFTQGGTYGYIDTRYSDSFQKYHQKQDIGSVVEDLECKSEYMRVFTKATIPKRHHLFKTHRLGQVYLTIKDTWLITDGKRRVCYLDGNHGYDNIFKSMQALFVAYGPSFKQNLETQPFENIELYNLMCNVLGIEPAPNNGTSGTLDHLLQSPPPAPDQPGLAKVTDCELRNIPVIAPCKCDNSLTVNGNLAIQKSPMPPSLKPVPVSTIINNSCLVKTYDYDILYSHTHNSALWSTFKLSPKISVSLSDLVQNFSSGSGCVRDNGFVRPDVVNIWCQHQIRPDNLTYNYLFEPFFATLPMRTYVAGYVTNVVPMYRGFIKDLWHHVLVLLVDYARHQGSLSVAVGPIWDSDGDGLADIHNNNTKYVDSGSIIPIPTHYYIVMTKCTNQMITGTSCDSEDIDILSFVLPHLDVIPNCLKPLDYLRDNVIRIRDIELLTGLQFFANLPNTKAAQLRTFLPVEIWPTSLEKFWVELSCIDDNQISQCPAGTPPLLLIGLDGFKADYLTRNITPVLQRLSQCGVHSPWMRPVYPTLTFPNMYTLVTGLYPESHGLIGNSMYDLKLQERFSISRSFDSDIRWWGGEPIWNTVMKQGKTAGTLFWTGSDRQIGGMYPNYTIIPYSSRYPYEERVDKVLEWLDMSEDQRPHFMSMYLSEPDHSAHRGGIHSMKTDEALKFVDGIMGRLMDGLMERGLQNCVNIIVVADHGMANTDCANQVRLRDYLSSSEINKVYTFEGPQARMATTFRYSSRKYIVNDPPESTEEYLEKLQCKNDHLKAYKKTVGPARHHYINNDRIEDIILDTDPGWLIARYKYGNCAGANHGWDNIYTTLGAVFMAHGPSFKSGLEIQQFENIELYGLMAELMKITAAPNNGTRGSLYHLLKSPPPLPEPVINRYQQCDRADDGIATPVLNCSCDDTLTDQMWEDLSDPRKVNSSSEFMLVFGAPQNRQDNNTVCQLSHPTHITGYNGDLNYPAWVVYHLTPGQIIGNGSIGAGLDCVINDRRAPLPEDITCADPSSNLITVPLIPIEFVPGNSNYTKLTSSTVQMLEGFQSGIWTSVLMELKIMTMKSQWMSVATGPIFDSNHDGLADTPAQIRLGMGNDTEALPVASHFYLTIIWCDIQMPAGECQSYYTLSFILPHLNHISGCMSAKKYLNDHVARLRDIELMTGLEFLTSGMSTEEALRLRLYLPPMEVTATPPQPTRTTARPTTSTPQHTLPPVDWMNVSCDIPSPSQCSGSSVPLLLISLDGFRADYLQRHLTPVINRLGQCGVHTPYMRSVFPTMTFPNHYSIVTGLYPESHGIVGNTMYDEKIGKLFTLRSSTKMDPVWWGGEPIWITAKKQGKKTAAYFWVGSDVNITGVYPDRWFMYDGSHSNEDRINKVLDWLSLPDAERPDIITTYFNEPDHEGHDSGPFDEKMNEMLMEVDDVIKSLMDGLATRDLHQCVNIMVVADHGLTSTHCYRELDYSDFTNTSLYFTQGGTYGYIDTRYSDSFQKYPQQQDIGSIVEELQCKSEYMRVFTKATIPKRHHLFKTQRLGQVYLTVKDTWLITDGKRRVCYLDGNHGYDNIFKSMQALFVAYGPSFKQNLEAQPFENIELYNLMCNVLGIKPAPNNGTFGTLDHLLQSPPPAPDQPGVTKATDCELRSLITDPCKCDSSANMNGNIAVPKYPLPPSLKPVPVLTIINNSCLVKTYDYDVLYSHTHNLALWSTYKLSPIDSVSLTGLIQKFSNGSGCVRDNGFVRPEVVNIWCQQLEQNNITYNYLFEPFFSTSPERTYLAGDVTNVVPMYRGFIKDLWHHVLVLLVDYARHQGSLSVTVGPIWDNNGDGLADIQNNYTKYVDTGNIIPLPTHYYIVMTKCTNQMITGTSCDVEDIDILSFVLPHVDVLPNCLKPLDYLRDNVIRIRDIELLTGLQFFTDLPSRKAAQLRTFLPVEIWPTNLEKFWVDLPCDDDSQHSQCPAGTPPLLLIGLDGFKADYLARNITPVLQRLSQCGVRSPWMRPVYPSLTFPNMYTLATGLYPESHGLIGNSMYDLKLQERFSISRSFDSDIRWWGGEPIWNTVMKQGKTAGTLFWTGSDRQIGGMYPNYTIIPYSSGYPYEERVDKVLEWLDMSEGQRPHFISMYLSEPDYSAHRGGIHSMKTDEALKIVDGIMGRLMDGLLERELQNCVNIIVVADHGMTNTDCANQVRLRDYLSSSEINKVYTFEGPQARMATTFRYSSGKYIVNDPPESTEDYLEKLQCKNDHLKAYTKTAGPARHHYINNDRIEDIILDTDPGWLIARYKYRYCAGANHGWDNIYTTLGAVFMAHGPSFKSSLEIQPFENIELYGLMSELMNITAAPNNGTKGSLFHMLKSPPPLPEPVINRYQQCDGDVDGIATPVFNCSCDDTLTHQIWEDLSDPGQMNSSSESMLTFGAPQTLDNNNNVVCQLSHPTHITGYNGDLNYPVWVVYHLTVGQVKDGPIGSGVECVINDRRAPLHGNITCADPVTNLTTVPLIPIEIVPGNTNYPKLSSSTVQMLEGFRSGIWTSVLMVLKSMTPRSRWMSVTAGPIFDSNHDGLADTPGQIRLSIGNETEALPVASHFYLTIIRCDVHRLADECQPYNTLSFIMPHIDHISSCMSSTKYLSDHVARIRDIELMTGLQFLTSGMSPEEALRLRLYLPSMEL